MNVDFTNFLSVLNAIRSRYPATHKLQIAFNNFVVDVFVNNKSLAGALEHYFAEFIVKNPQRAVNTIVTVHDAPPLSLPYAFTLALPPSPHKKIKHEWTELDKGRVVHHRITDMHYLVGNGQNCIAGPCMERKNQVVNFINSRFITNQVDNGYLLGHASAVTANGRGLIICGNSGAGKSTLALHMLTNGADFVSNDRVLIPNNGSNPFYGTLQQPRINPGTALNNPSLQRILSPEERIEFGRMPPETLWQTEHKFDAIIPECYGKHRFIPHAPLSAVAIMDWRRNSEPMMFEQLTAQEARYFITHMMKKNDLLYVPKNKGYTDPTINDYIQALKDKPIFILQGGVDFAQATEKLTTFLNTGSTGA